MPKAKAVTISCNKIVGFDSRLLGGMWNHISFSCLQTWLSHTKPKELIYWFPYPNVHSGNCPNSHWAHVWNRILPSPGNEHLIAFNDSFILREPREGALLQHSVDSRCNHRSGRQVPVFSRDPCVQWHATDPYFVDLMTWVKDRLVVVASSHPWEKQLPFPGRTALHPEAQHPLVKQPPCPPAQQPARASTLTELLSAKLGSRVKGTALHLRPNPGAAIYYICP